MFDIESLMQEHVEPKDVRKRPNGLKKWLSFMWPQKIAVYSSNVSGQLQLLAWKGRFLLDTAKVNYSFGSLHRVMEKSLDKLKSMNCLLDRVLLLGYGGGSSAEIIHQQYQRDAEIVGVELDAVVVELAKSFFYSKGVRIMQENAFDYLKKASESSWEYDLIIVDLFVNDSIPEGAFRSEFFQQLSTVAKGGMVAINTMKNKDGLFGDAQLIAKMASAYFTNIISCEIESTNNVVICK